MGVTHIVLFQFKSDADPELVKEVCPTSTLHKAALTFSTGLPTHVGPEGYLPPSDVFEAVYQVGLRGHG